MSSDISAQSDDLEISQILRIIGERKWIIIGLAILAVCVSVAYSMLTTPQYRATSQVLMQTDSLDTVLFGAQVFAVQDEQRALTTYAQSVTLDTVAKAVKKELSSSRSVESLKSMISVTTSSTSNMLDISAQSADPREAANVANSFARQFILYRQQQDRSTLRTAREQVQAQLNGMTTREQSSTQGVTLAQKSEELAVLESMQTGGFELSQQATTPSNSVSPRVRLNTAVALFLGIVVGLVVVIILAFADRRMKDEDVVEREMGAPVIGSVPLTGASWKGRGKTRSRAPVGFSDLGSASLESYRALRSNLKFFEVKRPIRSILISSPLPREGKTVTTVNLALSYAMSGSRVIVLEGDLRRPMIQEYLGLNSNLGFSNLLAGTHTVSEVAQVVDVSSHVPFGSLPLSASPEEDGGRRVENTAILCISAGPLPPNPAELLASEACGSIIKELAGLCDHLIIDGPPLLLVSDAVELASKVDGVILVTRFKSTKIEEARRTRQVLEKVGIRPLGVVVSGVAKAKSYYNRYGGYYTSS